MVTMHGLFDLKPGITAEAYGAAFEAFCRHLKDQGYVTDWRFMRRAPHPGYDRNPPESGFYVGIDFPDRETADECYRYVAADAEPLRTLHRTMNSKVVPTTTCFFLFEAAPG
jgi:hypothetical protein